MKRLLLHILLFLIMSSCATEDMSGIPVSQEDKIDLFSLNDLLEAQALYHDIERIALFVVNGGRYQYCPKLTFEKSIVTVDFEKNGCLDTNDWSRYGKIIIDHNRLAPNEKGFKMAITFDGYQVKAPLHSQATLDGSITISNTSGVKDKTYTLEYVLSKGVLTDSEGQVSKWESSISRTFQLPFEESNSFSVKGVSNGVNKENEQLQSNILEPLLVNPACLDDGNFYPLEGMIELESKDQVKKIDFKPHTDQEDDQCNKVIAVIFDDREYIIEQ